MSVVVFFTGRSGYRMLFVAGIVFLALISGAVADTPALAGGTDPGTSIPESLTVIQSSIAVPLPEPTPGGTSGDWAENLSKLEISPSYVNVALTPGDTKETTITVRNRNTRSVRVEPVVRQTTYAGPNLLDPSWVSVDPAGADIPPGETQKFTITTSVPSDALRGNYYGSVAYTNETYPSPYPQPVPNYLYTTSVSVNVISQPAVRISMPYIMDQLEAGKEYRYEITLTNTGSSAVPIDPVIRSDSYPVYSSYGTPMTTLNESAFRVSAPSSVPAGSNATVAISVTVPTGVSGYYSGYLDLGIDDPALLEGEDRVQLNFQVWSQPPGSFVKEFSLDAAGPISIELTSGVSGYALPVAAARPSGEPVREPSFETDLNGPDGNSRLTLVQKVIRGTVSTGGSGMPYGSSADSFQEVSTQYVFTYAAQGKPGSWKLQVTPKNTQSFDYRITLEEDGGNITSLQNQPTAGYGTISMPSPEDLFPVGTNRSS